MLLPLGGCHGAPRPGLHERPRAEPRGARATRYPERAAGVRREGKDSGTAPSLMDPRSRALFPEEVGSERGGGQAAQLPRALGVCLESARGPASGICLRDTGARGFV